MIKEGGTGDGLNAASAKAITKLHDELSSNPKMLLYFDLHKNVWTHSNLDPKKVAIQAKDALEKGAAPKLAGDEYTKNARDALNKIASEIKESPIKFAMMSLHSDAIEYLGSNVNLSDIKNSINREVKKGKSILVDGKLADNGKEAIERLTSELLDDKKLWLHISLDKDVQEELEKKLSSKNYSIENLQKAALLEIKDGENPKTDGAFTENALNAIRQLGDDLKKDEKMWLYITLDDDSLTRLIQGEGIDLAVVKQASREHLLKGGAFKYVGNPTANAKAIAETIATEILRNKKIMPNARFSQDTADAIKANLQGHDNLIKLVNNHTEVAAKVQEAMGDEIGHEAAGHAKYAAAQKVVKNLADDAAESSEGGWFSWLMGSKAGVARDQVAQNYAAQDGSQDKGLAFLNAVADLFEKLPANEDNDNTSASFDNIEGLRKTLASNGMDIVVSEVGKVEECAE